MACDTPYFWGEIPPISYTQEGPFNHKDNLRILETVIAIKRHLAR